MTRPRNSEIVLAALIVAFVSGAALAFWTATPAYQDRRFAGLKREIGHICTVIKWVRAHPIAEVQADLDAIKGCHEFGREP